MVSTVPGQNRDEKVGMVHGRLVYMRQVAYSSKVGMVHGARQVLVHVVQ
eukprot:COSAG02_NODE_1156_length_14189_cov_3.970334_6_plen_49_part_00